MAIGVGGGGFLGIGLETTPGTYTAPTKFFPIQSESLRWIQETVWRRPIRKAVSVIGAVPGNGRCEGDIVFEAFEDVVPYFHMCSRATVTKTGTAPNFIYTFNPSPAAVPPNKTMSVTVVRNDIVYGYTGCVVGSFTYSIDNGQLISSFSVMGRDEATQALPTPTFSDVGPFGAGMYDVEIPSGNVVTDTDTFSFQVEDNATPEYRLKSTGRGAQYIRFGEQAASMSMSRDFESRAKYDEYRNLTAEQVDITAARNADRSIKLSMPAIIKDDFTINLSGQGDLLRADISYQATADPATGFAYSVEVKTGEDLTVA